MRNRLIALAGAITLAVVGILASPRLFAQSTSSSAKGTIARTADGHPDLSGMYDVATMTPLQRPAEFGNRRALTKEEAAEMEQDEKQRQEKSAAPSNPDPQAPPVGGDTSPTHSDLEALFRFGGGVVGGYNTFWISPGDSFAVVNGEKRTSIIIDPPDGHEPAMKSDAAHEMPHFGPREPSGRMPVKLMKPDPPARSMVQNSGRCRSVASSGLDRPQARPRCRITGTTT